MRYVAALDVGTTTVRFHIINEHGSLVASSLEKVELLYPQPGYVEIDPDQLWLTIIHVIKNTLREARLEPNSIACLGISTQRGSFATWNSETGKYYHKFITWKDLRANSLVEEWNRSITMKGIRMGSHVLYTLSRSKRFLAGSVFKFMNTQMTLRLTWAFLHIPGLKEDASHGKVMFGGVDCWLLYKFTGKHVSDVSSASATGLYDPFTMQWADWLLNILKLPRNIFPEVVDTAKYFGTAPTDIFGCDVPILSSMADQAASLFGSGCFKPGDLKVTMGTGSFLDANTGLEPHASITGLYPLVGWRIGSEIVYVVEGASNDTGTAIDWIKSLGIIREPSETSDLASSVNDSDGIYFVPAFSGLQAPINNQKAAAGFLGVKPTSEKSHIVRSLLESLVFRILFLYESMRRETKFEYRSMRVDGGVSKNNFIMQLLADLTGLDVERAGCSEMSIIGVAFCAGLQCGIWKSREEISKLRKPERVFEPSEKSRLNYQSVFHNWMRAIERFKDWY